ncbi:chromatin assembly factor 1 subunit rlf2 [Podospora conica]|nr:chromatin assembly factor 1 subunit rlf2 [Schizothecium conicum]
MAPPLDDVTNHRQEPGSARKRSHDDFAKPDSSDAVQAQGADLSDHPVESLSDKENDDDIDPADRMDCSPDGAEPPSSPLSNPPSPEATPKKDNSASAQGTPVASTSATSPKATPTTKAKITKGAASKTTGEPPAKKPKLSFAQKQEAEREKEAAKAKKAAQAAEKEAAKLKKAAEAEEAKAKKAAEAAEKEAAKAKKAAELEAAKQAREAAKAKKAAEKQAKEADLLKKAVNHQVEKMIMANFLKPKEKIKTEKSDATMKDAPSSPSKSAYDKLFKPFFVKQNVTVAKQPFEMDEETREAKSKILEAYVDGSREHVPTMLRDNVLDILQIPFRSRRGRPYPSVKDIMAKHSGNSVSMAIDLTTDSHNQALKALESVPVKTLKFREDVRPPYVGTVSGLPAGLSSLRKVAIHPATRAIPTLDYDYDSEAEWQEDDGEDVDLDDMDDEEVDPDEDMDDFLDDSEDVGPARPAFSGGMEPESTGLCWEDHNRLNTTIKTYKFRMEFMLDTLEHHNLIDPFSDVYWKPAGCTATTSAAATASSTGSGLTPASAAAPKPGFQTLPKRPAKTLSSAVQNEFKDYLRSKSHLKKLGLVEVFYSEHPGSATKLQLNALFDTLTVPAIVDMDAPGGGRKPRKHWRLKEDVQMAA